jgi:L-amino acid N-acyltransferase YncA
MTAAFRHVVVRPCFDHDLDQVRLIYAHHVATGAGTFDIEPPPFAAMHERWRKVVAAGWPYIVASPPDDPARILGFAYAQQYRDRAAYAQTVEDSVYVAPGFQGRGLGFALLSRLLVELQESPAEQVIAVIGDSGNVASIALHAKLGFHYAGTLTSVGFKFGRWVDVVLMQRSLKGLVLASIERPES